MKGKTETSTELYLCSKKKNKQWTEQHIEARSRATEGKKMNETQRNQLQNQERVKAGTSKKWLMNLGGIGGVRGCRRFPSSGLVGKWLWGSRIWTWKFVVQRTWRLEWCPQLIIEAQPKLLNKYSKSVVVCLYLTEWCFFSQTVGCPEWSMREDEGGFRLQHHWVGHWPWNHSARPCAHNSVPRIIYRYADILTLERNY